VALITITHTRTSYNNADIPQISKVRIDTPEAGLKDAIYRYNISTPATNTAAY